MQPHVAGVVLREGDASQLTLGRKSTLYRIKASRFEFLSL